LDRSTAYIRIDSVYANAEARAEHLDMTLSFPIGVTLPSIVNGFLRAEAGVKLSAPKLLRLSDIGKISGIIFDRSR
jgi:hypothetical protein